MIINWNEVQKYYDDGHTIVETSTYFGISQRKLYKASKEGKLKTRSISNSLKISKKTSRKHTEETRLKISQIRKKYLLENPDKVPYLLNHSRNESYPEKYFTEIFEKSGLEFVKNFRIGLYELDFSVPDKKIDIEIDGEQHYCDQNIIDSDNRRNDFLKSEGWDIIRIRWSEYKKMNYDESSNYISSLLLYINRISENKPKFVFEKKEKRKKEKSTKLTNLKKDNYSLGKKCISCESIITNHTKTNNCSQCYRKQSRKVLRPSLEQLNDDIEKLGYTATGRKYGVSDNSIRKWLKQISKT